jgi:hypothetical protein
MSRVTRARARRRASMLRWAARRAAKRHRRTVDWYVRELGRHNWPIAADGFFGLSLAAHPGPRPWEAGIGRQVIEDVLAYARDLEARFARVPTHVAVCGPMLDWLRVALPTERITQLITLPVIRDDTVPLGMVEQRTGRPRPRTAFDPLVLPLEFEQPSADDPELIGWGDSIIAKVRPFMASMEMAFSAASIFWGLPSEDV